MPEGDRQQPPEPPDKPPEPPDKRPGPPEKPEYTVYRSRRRLSDIVRKPDLSGLRKRLPGGEKAPGEKPGERPPPLGPEEPERRFTWQRGLKWAGLAALVWLTLSIIAFAVSSQIQKWKLAEGVTEVLEGGPLLVGGQTILVLGTDVRSGAFAGADEAETKNCLEAINSGKGTDNNCSGNYRADTIMLIRGGIGSFRKLSIPRDTLAPVPGHGPQKINSAYALGGAKLAIRTVEDMLGINVDQVAIIDFDGFRNFIDTIGGITVDLPTPVCSEVSGGAFNLNLDEGEHDLDGFQAITLARTRANTCGTGEFASSDDTDRAQFQQLILDGIKSKLTSITSLPMNFIKGPIIAWNAPKAMVSSMGALTMPQLAIASATGGGDSDVLEPSGTTGSGNLVISPEECERAAEKLLGEEPPRKPNCPQS
jgi:LCP family protein required for cell wall assembly